MGGRGLTRGRVAVLLSVVAIVAVVVAAIALSRGAPGGALGLDRDGARAYESLGMNAARYERVADMVAAVQRDGGSCDGLVSRSPSTGQRERVECKSSRDDVIIHIFDSPGARNAYLADSRAILQQSQFDAVPTLAGPNWLVSADTQQTIEVFRHAIGGEIVK
jgi:hypothetical protein